MKRRDLLKRALVAPFLGVLAGAKVSEPVNSRGPISAPVSTIGDAPFSGASHLEGVGPVELYINGVRARGIADVYFMDKDSWGPRYLSIRLRTPDKIYMNWLSGEPERVNVKLIVVSTGLIYDFEAICCSEVVNGGTFHRHPRYEYEFKSARPPLQYYSTSRESWAP